MFDANRFALLAVTCRLFAVTIAYDRLRSFTTALVVYGTEADHTAGKYRTVVILATGYDAEVVRDTTLLEYNRIVTVRSRYLGGRRVLGPLIVGHVPRAYTDADAVAPG